MPHASATAATTVMPRSGRSRRVSGSEADTLFVSSPKTTSCAVVISHRPVDCGAHETLRTECEEEHDQHQRHGVLEQGADVVGGQGFRHSEEDGAGDGAERAGEPADHRDRKSTRLNSSHVKISY